MCSASYLDTYLPKSSFDVHEVCLFHFLSLSLSLSLSTPYLYLSSSHPI